MNEVTEMMVHAARNDKKETVKSIIKYMSFYLAIVITSMSLFLTACGVDSNRNSSQFQEESNSAILTWEAPTTNIDNTPLTDLKGYKIYYGLDTEDYKKEIDIEAGTCRDLEDKTECTFTIENLDPGNYSFYVTAHDTSGNESEPSNTQSKTIY